MDAARTGDLRTMRKVAQNIQPSSSIAGAENPTATTPLWRLAHYNGQGTSYGFIGSIALHWAAANDDIPMLKFLLSEPFNSSVNCQNLGGSTPLHSACSNGRLGAAQLLLSYGANPTIVDVCQDSPLQVIPPPEVARARLGVKETRNNKNSDPLAALRQLILGAGRLAALAQSSPDPNQWALSDLKAIATTFGPYLEEASGGGASSLIERQDFVAFCRRILSHWQSLSAASDVAAHDVTVLHRGVHERHLQRLLDAEKEKMSRREARTASKHSEQSTEAVASGQEEDSDLSEEEAESMMAQERADAIKAKANVLYQNGDFKGAIKAYTAAIAVHPLGAVLYSNRAAAHLALATANSATATNHQTSGTSSTSASQAIQDCRAAIMLDPTYSKPVYRLAQALLLLGRHTECMKVCRDALETKDGGAQSYKLTSSDHEAFRNLLATAEHDLTISSSSSPTSKNATNTKQTAAASTNISSIPKREPLQAPPVTNCSATYVDPAGRRPWFDCPLCENRTRDRVDTPCCSRPLCGTCWRRRVCGECPFCSKVIQE